MMNEDHALKKLVEYLAQELNAKFYPIAIVKTTRTFNSMREPLSNLPLLKCYRERDVLMNNMTVSKTDVIIEYDMAYPKDNTLNDYAVIIGHCIADLLVYPKCYEDSGLLKVANYSDTEIRYKTDFSNFYQSTLSTVQLRSSFYTPPLTM